MRVLNSLEIDQVSGGAPTHWTDRSVIDRAEPGTKVVAPSIPGNRTGWCRGYGNLKDGPSKHQGVTDDCITSEPM